MRYVYIIIHTATHEEYGNLDFNFKDHSDVYSSHDKAIEDMNWRHSYDIKNEMKVTNIEYVANPSPYHTAELCSFTSIDKYGFTTKHQLFRSPL